MSVPAGWPSFRAAIGVILVVGLVVRVGLLVATPNPQFVPHSDPADYDLHAMSIAAGDGYPDSPYAPGGGPTALRPPLYPYALAGVYAVTGHSITAARLLSVLLGVLTVALIGLVTCQLAGRRAAIWASALGAVYPPLVLASGTLISEALSLPLMLGALAAALHGRAPAHRTLPWAALAGLLLGLGVLARPAMGVVALPVALLLWGRPWRSPRSLAAPAVAAIAAIAAVAPWTIRNHDEFGAFVPVFTQSGYLLAGTYNEVSMNDPNYPGAFRPAILVPEYRRLFEQTNLGELALSRRMTDGATNYIREHPGAVPKAMFRNLLRILLLERGAETGRASYAAQGIGTGHADLTRFAFYAMALLALSGLALRAGRRWWWLLWGTTAVLLLSVIPISSDTRYRLQLEPLLVLLAGLAVTAWLDRRAARMRSARAP